MKKYAVIKLLAYSFTAVLLSTVLVIGIIFDAGNALSSRFFDEFFEDENYVSAESSEIKITDAVNNIDVEWVSGNVTVILSEDENIHVLEACDDGLSSSDSMVYKVDGDTLEIDFCKQSSFDFSAFGFNVSIPSKDLFLKLPEKYYDKISITSVSAEVGISNISVSEIDIESVSGDIELNSTEFSETDIETVSGNADIYLPAVSSFRAEIDSVSGNFNTDFEVTKQGDAYICGDGSIEIAADTVSGNVGVYKKQ